MTMKNKTFSFAGLTLRFESENPIADSPLFSAFLSEKEPECTVKVQVGALPEKRGEAECTGKRSVLYLAENGEQRLFSSYFNARANGLCDYACFERRGAEGILYITENTELRDAVLMNAVGLPRLLLEKGAGILHSSFIVYKGEALLFIGESGVGKTTQARLWEKHRASLLVNGDRCVLTVQNGVLTACGLPFCGSSEIAVNACAPVRAFVSLSQAVKNTVTKPPMLAAYRAVLSCLTYEPRSVFESRAAGEVAMNAVNGARVVSLACTPDERAVRTLEENLWQE